MVQLKDIAKKLNLSVATVSKVINGKGRVSEATRDRVLKAIAESGYKPNELARSLRRQSSNTLGVIVPDLTNNFYANVIKGVEKIAWQNGYSVIVCNSDENIEKEKAYLDLLLQNKIAGLVMATVAGHTSMIRSYREANIPVVFFDNVPHSDENFDVVTIDNIRASYELTRHLIDQGTREIAFITGPLNQSTSYDRLTGFRRCMEDHGLQVKDKLVAVDEFKLESGYRIMRKWLADGERPEALFAANNFILYGAIRAITEAGLTIPDDIKVVCFDALDDTGLIRPEITTVMQPAYDIGVIAGEIIMRKEANKELKVFEKIVLEPKMYIRASSLGKPAR